MGTTALIVVITVAFATLVALALVVLVLVRRVQELAARVSTIQERLEPELDTLARETEVAGAQLERLAESAERLRGDDTGTVY